MRIHPSHSQIVDAIQAAVTANVPYCFIGGVAAHIHSIRAGRGARRWSNCDVLIDITSKNLHELHSLFAIELMMYPLPQGCPGIHAFADPTYRRRSTDGEYYAMFYSGLDDVPHNSIRLFARFDPLKPTDVISRAIEHTTERGQKMMVATIDDLLANKKLAAASSDRSEERRQTDKVTIAFLESLLAGKRLLN